MAEKPKRDDPGQMYTTVPTVHWHLPLGWIWIRTKEGRLDVDAFNARLAELQARVDAGDATPQDLADLNTLADELMRRRHGQAG